MVNVREPILEPVSIDRLRPTQITVGMREVNEKRERLRKEPSNKIGTFLGNHMIPVVLGPKQHRYVIDHHHLALALHKEGMKEVLVTVVSDLSTLDSEAFWVVLDHRNWIHPYDSNGQRRHIRNMPKRITDLVDDPFRSLAGELRRAGGYSKETTPFSEFLWADFLRRRINRKIVETHFSASLKQALRLSKSRDAHYLPGWCGPTD